MKTNRKFLSVLIFGLLFSFLYLYPLLFSSGQLGIQDWNQNFAWNEFTRVSILKYGQFPLWNPYRCGGLPQFGNPEIGVISLQTIFVLLFGTLLGIKISIYVYIFLAFIGFFLYSRQYMSRVSALFAAIIYAFSGITASFLSTGMVVFISFAFIPYTLYFFEKGMNNWKHLIYSSFIFAFCFYNGHHIALLLGIYIVVYSLLLCIFDKSFKSLKRLVIFIMIVLVLILPRLILSTEFMKMNKLQSLDRSGYTVSHVLYSLLSPVQDLYHDKGVARYSWKVDETALYIGIPAFIFFLYSFFSKKWPREKKIVIGIFIIVLVFMFGYQSFVPLYPLLKKIPILESFRVAQRFRFLIIVPLALCIGYGYERLRNYISLNGRRIVTVIALLIIGGDLIYFAYSNYFFTTLIYQMPPLHKLKEFAQVRTARYLAQVSEKQFPNEYRTSDIFSMWSVEYPAILENKGIINCSDTVIDPQVAIGYDMPVYRGEWHMLNSSGVVYLKKWTPQTVKLEIQLKHNIDNDYLIFNQNYYPGWYAQINNGELQKVQSVGGRIAVQLQPNSKEVIFKYLPFKDLHERINQILTLFFTGR
jgi:hypothetical protein